jgi:hypothetical protein
MRITLDEQDLFDGQELELEASSIKRASVERAMSGLDGVLSIDLGQRSRQITQKGVLRTASRTQMDARISDISAYMDGNTHTLTDGNGRSFAHLRMDVFKVSNERTSGIGVVVDYEIVYTQLKV